MKTSGLQFKMLFIMAACVGLAVTVSVFALVRVYGSVRDIQRVTRDDFDTQQAILLAEVAYRNEVNAWKNVLVRSTGPATADEHWKAFLKDEKRVVERVERARSMTRDHALASLLDEFLARQRAVGERYRKGFEALVASHFDVHAGNKPASGAKANPDGPLLDAEKKAAESGAAAIGQAVDRARESYSIAIAATVAAMLATLLALWIFLRKAVLRPIQVAMGAAERIAAGDLTGEVRATSRDETGQLLRALERMNGSLAQVVSQVRAASDNVASASAQVAAGTTDLSQRTEEQATSLEETAASMEELSSTVAQNSESARQADELARRASQRAEQGGAEVMQAVGTMQDVSASAGRIVDIIAVIDGIAFQTNILALNAAVEAARAGEQGRGFAVVASEVRSLAQRSAQAAREIKDLVGASVDKVANGTRLVEKAGGTIQTLVADVRQVSELMASIAHASTEQSRGVQQVNKTVSEMDKAVQQNASAVQESAAAAEGMRGQAGALIRAVGAFRLPSAARAADASEAPRALNVRPVPRSAKPRVAAPLAQPALATAGGPDDWKEF